MIRVYIVEDDPRHMATLQAKVVDQGFWVVGSSSTSAQALLDFKETLVDVVLMDINLGKDEEGIELANTIQEEYDVPIIFVTSMTADDTIKHAIKASPAGYLLKPVDPVELKANIELAVQKSNRANIRTKESCEYLTVRLGQKLQKIYFKDISHLKVESKNYVTLVDRQKKKAAVRGSLKNMLDSVLPDGFLRTHHAHGINLAYVEFIDESTQSIHLSTGEFIPIGKVFKKKVYNRMNIA